MAATRDAESARDAEGAPLKRLPTRDSSTRGMHNRLLKALSDRRIKLSTKR
jgi:hypothetical protein